MPDGAGGRGVARRRLLLGCLTSFFAGVMLGAAGPAAAVDAPVLTSHPDGPLALPSATWTWTADGDATVDCWLLTEGTPGPGPDTWFPCSSGAAIPLAAGDGEYALVVRATASTPEGPVSAQSEPSPYVRLDTTAPLVAITASPASPSSDRAPVWGLDVEPGSAAVCRLSGPGGVVLEASCASGTWTADLSGQPEGAWSFVVTAIDEAGNRSSVGAPADYVLDVAPEAPVVTAPRSLGNDPAPAWSFVLPSDSTAACTLSTTDGDVLSEPCTPGWSPLLPRDGTYTATVVLIDAAGPSDPGSAVYTYDGTAPDRPLVDGPSGRTTDPTLVWSFAVPEGTTAQCALVQSGVVGPAGPCATPHAAVVGDGSWALEVVLVDEATNTSVPGRSAEVKVDTTAPAVPQFTTVPSSPSRASSFTWNWDATEIVSCRVRTAPDADPGWTRCADGGLTLSTAELLDGAVSMDVRSADDLGNTSGVATSTVLLDRVAPGEPVVTGTSGVGQTPSAAWSWTADDVVATADCWLLRDSELLGGPQPCAPGQEWALPQDAHWALAVRLTDAAGNTSGTATGPTYQLDQEPPAAPVVSGPDGTGNQREVTWTVDGESDATVTCRLERDDAVVTDWETCPRSVEVALDGDGAWRLLVGLIDTAGNASPLVASAPYLLDTATPDAPLVSGPAGPSSTATVTWTWTGDPTAAATCRLLRDAVVVVDWEPCGTSERRALTDDGRWLWQVQLTDAAGNATAPADSPVYVLDRKAPDAPLVAAPASPSASRTPVFLVSGEAGTAVDCRVLLGADVLRDWQPCDRAVELDLGVAADGAYRVEARLTDAAGNQSLAGTSAVWVLDTMAPTVPSVTGTSGDGSSSTPTWTWTPEEGAASECALLPSGVSPTDWYACSPAHAPQLPSEGSWRLHVRVRDAAGNVSQAGTGPEYRFDQTAPTVPTVVGPASPGRATAITWTFTAEPAAQASCAVTGPDDAVPSFAACTSPLVLDLSGRPQGAYRLDVRVRDAAGNTSGTGSVEYVLDTVAPDPASVLAPPSPSADPVIRWWLRGAEPDLSATCTLLRDGAAVESGACPVDPAGSGFTTDVTERGDGTYRLEVVVRDLAGGTSAASGATYVHDTTPPPPVKVVPPPPTGSSRTPSWQLTGEAGARLECRFGPLGDTAPCAASGVYVADLVGAPDGDHALSVWAVDRAGNVGPVTTTSYRLDTEPPLAPVVTGPGGSPGRQSAPEWSWEAAEPETWATCTLVLGTRVVAAVACTERVVLTLPEDGTYLLSVTLTDAAGNPSLAGTATYTRDTTPPAAPVVVGPGSPSSIAAPVFGFDAEEGSSVECRTLRGPGLDALVVDGSGWEPCQAGLLSLQVTGEQTYRVDVRATDAAGNTSEAAEYVYVYSATAPAGLDDLVRPASPGSTGWPSWTFTAPSGATTTCTLTGPAGQVESGQCVGGFRPPSPLTVEGRYVLRVVVRDVHGNLGTNDLLYVLDTTGPEAPVVTPSGAVGRAGQVQWGWTIDPTATAQCLLEHDGRAVQGWQPCSPGVQQLGQWGGGTYVLSVRGVDRVGNVGAVGRGDYTWRAAGPTALGVSTTSPTTGGPGPVLWTFPVPADALAVSCGVRRDGAFVAGPTACRGSYVMNLAGQRDGGYEVVVRFADTAGNTTEQVRTYVLSTVAGPVRAPVQVALAPPSRPLGEASSSSVSTAIGEVLPLLPAGVPPPVRGPGPPAGLGDGSGGLPAPLAAASGDALRPGLALAQGGLSGSAAVEALRDVATETIKRPGLPVALLLLVLLFLLVQNRIDYRDPKLAGPVLDEDEQLEFRPLRATVRPDLQSGGAPA